MFPITEDLLQLVEAGAAEAMSCCECRDPPSPFKLSRLLLPRLKPKLPQAPTCNWPKGRPILVMLFKQRLNQESECETIIIGGGHAATIAVRAAMKGLLRSSTIAAVAPTWAGPLPIVFGRSSDMESRYGLLRGTLRTPGVGWMVYNVLVSNEKSIKSQYESHVYADPKKVTLSIIESRYALTKRKGARYVPAAFLTGLLDPVRSREECLELFAKLDEKVKVLVVSTASSPKRSKAEMEALKGAKGVTKFVEVPGALLPQEEYPEIVADELYKFLVEYCM